MIRQEPLSDYTWVIKSLTGRIILRRVAHKGKGEGGGSVGPEQNFSVFIIIMDQRDVHLYSYKMLI